MSAPHEMWEAFLDWCRDAVTDRRKELDSLVAGTARYGRGYQGDWDDITEERIAQIEREVASLENTIAEYSAHAHRTQVCISTLLAVGIVQTLLAPSGAFSASKRSRISRRVTHAAAYMGPNGWTMKSTNSRPPNG
jgi:hypothetical protein